MFFELCEKNRPNCMKIILVLGATSAIAQAYCRLQASSGACFWLLGRNEDRLRTVAGDLRLRGAGDAEIRLIKADNCASVSEGIADAVKAHGRIDVFLIAQGELPDQMRLEEEPESVRDFFQGSVVTVVQGALLAAAQLELQGGGDCVIIGSVAGDRGRRRNYIYGGAKAALEVFSQGLRQRLAPQSRVVLLKPGPVDTPMTAHLAKSALFTTPEAVAGVLARALNRRRPTVVYAPGYWRWVMMIVRALPDCVVKKMRA
ncbi:SDR family NAD(P)-dependent oxidoreductase [Rariglobus hedericola]|uniref:SDR family NAD(P)-dependent oxidoreductase n=1 Tax=Rariglobus hedericola TaxID=2597822 RepID=A0A556QNL3_9BACT|nr:SDR family NAD(P)-dependent oxidoreductase [Rariglobus hedericola]TSJ78192.1 SDR family NAD(P)-dependent oxidoreductase [Rariglobus hedericola]